MFPPDTKILLAEDMSSVRDVLIETFNSIGFKNITSCKDGADAWEQMQDSSHPIDLIVSDMNMPNSNGLDLLKRVRSTSRFKNLPFLMISESADQEIILNAMKLGADYFLIKPFNGPELSIKLKKIYDIKIGSK